eukprot:UN10795
MCIKPCKTIPKKQNEVEFGHKISNPMYIYLDPLNNINCKLFKTNIGKKLNNLIISKYIVLIMCCIASTNAVAAVLKLYALSAICLSFQTIYAMLLLFTCDLNIMNKIFKTFEFMFKMYNFMMIVLTYLIMVAYSGTWSLSLYFLRVIVSFFVLIVGALGCFLDANQIFK